MASPPDIVCFGSLNYDLVIRVPHFPRPDETLHALGVEVFLGGKGANQITAAARLGARASMIGCVGADDHGAALVAGLDRNGVDSSEVRRTDVATGAAFPILAGDDVSIIVNEGANGSVSAADADRCAERIAAADVLLLQGEVPADAAGRAAAIAAAGGALVVFNPAPARPDVIAAVSPHAAVFVVNRTEAEEIDPRAGTTTVTTLGAQGAMIDGEIIAGFAATVVDPTGAGDAFCAALALRRIEGANWQEAVTFANAAGSVAVESLGAEPSLPTRAAVEARIHTTQIG